MKKDFTAENAESAEKYRKMNRESIAGC